MDPRLYGLLTGQPSPWDTIDQVPPEAYSAAFGIYPNPGRRAPGPMEPVPGLLGLDGSSRFSAMPWLEPPIEFAGQEARAPRVAPPAAPAAAPATAATASESLGAPNMLPRSWVFGPDAIGPAQTFTGGDTEASAARKRQDRLPMSEGGRPAAAPIDIAPRVPAPAQNAAPAPAASADPTLLQRMSDALNGRQNMLMSAGAALLSGKGFGGALEGAQAGYAADQKQANTQRSQLATYQALKARGLSDADALAAIYNPELAKNLYEQQYAKKGVEITKDGIVVGTDPGRGSASVMGSVPTWRDVQPGTTGGFVTAPTGGARGGFQPVIRGGPKTDEVDSFRKELTGAKPLARYNEAAPIFNSMVKSFGNTSRASDLDYVYGMAKIFDPDSVVREGEMVIVNKAQSLPGQLVGAIEALKGGGMLQPEVRRELLQIAKTRMDQYQQQSQAIVDHYGGIADRRGYNRADVLPPLPQLDALPIQPGQQMQPGSYNWTPNGMVPAR